MTPRQYEDAKDEVAKIKKKAGMAEGAFDRDLKALNELCGTNTVVEAEYFLESKKKELQDAQAEFNTMHAEFQAKWGGKF